MTLAAVAKCVYKHAHLARCMPAREPEVQGGRLPCPVSRYFREDHLVYRRKGAHNFYHGRIQICRIPACAYAKNDLPKMLVKVWRLAHIFLRNWRECNQRCFQGDMRRLMTSASVCLSLIRHFLSSAIQVAYHSFTISDQLKSNLPAALCFCNIASYSFSDISSFDSASW